MITPTAISLGAIPEWSAVTLRTSSSICRGDSSFWVWLMLDIVLASD